MVRIVGSLTTLPKRIRHLQPTLNSIIEQNTMLDMIYLNVPNVTLKGDTYTIPSFLSEEPYCSKITVQRCIDYGSITKIIPTLDMETDRDTLIATFDDDVIYRPYVITNLIEGIERHPNSCVGISGWVLGTFPFNYELVKFVNKDRLVDWLQGTHCVCYRRYLLDKRELLAHVDIPQEYHMQDDHILSFYVEKRGGQKWVVRSKSSVDERINVRHIDAISSNTNFFSQVTELCNIIRKKGYYNAKCKTYKTIGFYVLLSISVVTYGAYCIYRLYNPKPKKIDTIQEPPLD